MRILNNFTLEQVHLLLTDITTPVYSSDLTLAVAQETDSQNHHEQEIWFIKYGAGIIKSGAYAQVVVAGDLILLDSFEHHSILNTASSDLSFIAFWYADWPQINEYISNFNLDETTASNSTPLFILNDEKNGEISKLFLALTNALDTPYISYDTSNHMDYDINKTFLELKQQGQVFIKKINYPYDEHTQQFIAFEELGGKCKVCHAILHNISCHVCGYFHTKFQLVDPINRTTGSFLTVRPVNILYLSIDKSLLKQIELLYTQADDYSTVERSLLNKYSNSALLDFPLVCFAQLGQSINIDMGLPLNQLPLKIIPEIYRAFTAAHFYKINLEKNKGCLFVKLVQFYIYAIVFQKILLHKNPSCSLLKVRLDNASHPANIYIDYHDVSFLLTHFYQLNDRLKPYSFIIPDPGQWISKDILFIQDIQTSIKRFFYYANIDTFNAYELNRIRKKLIFEIAEYYNYLEQIDSEINERHYRTILTLFIYAVRWLLRITNIFLGNSLDLGHFDYQLSLDLNYGDELNPSNLIQQLEQIHTSIKKEKQ